MGVKVVRTRFAARTTTGTQDITASLGGLTPKAALFLYSYATADGTPAAGLARFIGATDGTTHALRRYHDGDNLDTTGVGAGADNTMPIVLTDPGGTILAEGEFSAWITDGITISWTVTTGTAILIDVIFFAGSDLSANVSITTLTNAVDTAHDITSVGFEPDDLIAFVAAGTGISLGFTHSDRASSYTQNSIYQRGRNGQATSQNMSLLRADYGCLVPAGSTSSDQSSKLEFGSFDSSGFSVTTRLFAPGSGVTLVVLALRYGTSPVVDSTNYIYSTPTATGSSTDANAGFTPQFVMYAASIMEATNTYYTDSLAGSHGTITIDATGQCCTAYTSEDNQDTTDTQSLSDDQAVNLPLDTGDAGLAATFTEFTTSGVTLNWSDVETNAKKWIGFAIGVDSAPPVEEAVSLSKFAGVTSNDLINLIDNILLDKFNGIIIASNSNILDAASLSNYLTITSEGVEVGLGIEESINLGIILRVTQPVSQNIEESVILEIYSGISNDNQILALNEITLNKVNAEGNGHIANIIDLATLAKFKAIQSIVSTNENGLVSLLINKTINSAVETNEKDLVSLLINKAITLATQTNEKDLVNLAKFIGISTSGDLQGIEENVTLSYSLNISILQEGISNVSENAVLNRLSSISESARVQVNENAVLNRLSSISESGQFQVNENTVLNRLTAINGISQCQVNDDLSLNRLVGITASELPFSINQSVTLNRLTGISGISQCQVNDNLSLNRLVGIIESELPFSITQSVSLNRLTAINGISQCQVNDSLLLNKFIYILVIDETVGQYSEILTLNRSIGISILQEGISHVSEGVTITRSNLININEESRIYNSLLFGRTNGISFTDQCQIPTSLIFARSSGLGLNAQISINENTTVSKFSVVNTFSQLVLNELLTLSKLDSLAILDSRYLLENINLERSNDLTLISSPSIFEEVELGKINILTIIAMLYGFNSVSFDQFKSIIAEPPSLYIYNDGNHSIGVLFRDKRLEVPFRDKRVTTYWRDKREK